MNRIFILILFVVIFTTSPVSANGIIQDELVNAMFFNKMYEKPEANLNYNYDDTDVIEIKLRITEPIKSENRVYEGQSVKFKVVSNVYYKDQLVVKRNEIVPAKVEVIIKNGMNGIPASILFGDFEFNEINKHLISDLYEVRGQDRSIIIYPLKWALTFIPGAGTLTNFIKGGHAKINCDKIVKIYYHPNWIKVKD